MQLSPSQKKLIERVINCFETGSPQGDYAAISIYADGPHNIKQITYGRSQTTEYGNLRELVAMYVAAGGLYSQALQAYADKVGSVPLTFDKQFKALLRQAGREDPVMQTQQDAFFDKRYFRPAMAWADEQGFTLPLSALVIYDSFIHSGSILWVIRQKFAESPPAAGGDEQAWIKAYVRERHKWLQNHPREAVRASAYRTRDLKAQVSAGNWQLAKVPVLAHGNQVTGEP